MLYWHEVNAHKTHNKEAEKKPETLNEVPTSGNVWSFSADHNFQKRSAQFSPGLIKLIKTKISPIIRFQGRSKCMALKTEFQTECFMSQNYPLQNKNHPYRAVILDLRMEGMAIGQ